MPLLLLDSNILSKLVRPDLDESRAITERIDRLFENLSFQICVPEIVDYELRRKLLHLANRPHQARTWAREALVILDRLVATGYIPLNTETMRLASRIWAQTRARGELRGTEESLDVDVILAAQAQRSGGYIVTTNEKHFRNIADVFDWRSYGDA